MGPWRWHAAAIALLVVWLVALAIYDYGQTCEPGHDWIALPCHGLLTLLGAMAAGVEAAISTALLGIGMALRRGKGELSTRQVLVTVVVPHALALIVAWRVFGWMLP